MAVAMLCDGCRGFDLAGFEKGEPRHCYGTADRPALAGVLGGFKCSCPCREELPTTSADPATPVSDRAQGQL